MSVILKVTQPVSMIVRTQIPNVGLRPKLASSPAQASAVWLRKQSCLLQEHLRVWERKRAVNPPKETHAKISDKWWNYFHWKKN